jgi:membrane protein
LLIFLILSTLFSVPARFLMRFVPTDASLLQLATLAGSFLAMTLIFGLIYKAIPDVRIGWGDVWIGAMATSAMFTAARLLIGLYLGKASIGSAYAASGSIVVFVTWVYYSAQVFLLGAEFTHVYALRHGSYAQARRKRSGRASEVQSSTTGGGQP